MPKPEGLERLVAQQEIRDLCFRYARGSDRVDDDILTSAFWEDGGFGQPYAAEPTSKIGGGVGAFMGSAFSCTHHMNGNILIDFIDADLALTEVYFQAFHLTQPDLTFERLLPLIGARRFAELGHADGAVYEIVVGGRYLDRVERRGGVWKIMTRCLVFDYCTVRQSAALLPGEGMMGFGRQIARDKSDPSYSQ